jgi:hypothetical protein
LPKAKIIRAIGHGENDTKTNLLQKLLLYNVFELFFELQVTAV